MRPGHWSSLFAFLLCTVGCDDELSAPERFLPAPPTILQLEWPSLAGCTLTYTYLTTPELVTSGSFDVWGRPVLSTTSVAPGLAAYGYDGVESETRYGWLGGCLAAIETVEERTSGYELTNRTTSTAVCDGHDQWTALDTTHEDEQIDGSTSEWSEHTAWDLTYDGADLVGATELDEQGSPLPLAWTWSWDGSHRMVEERYRMFVVETTGENVSDGSLDFTYTYTWSGDRLEAVAQRDEVQLEVTYERELSELYDDSGAWIGTEERERWIEPGIRPEWVDLPSKRWVYENGRFPVSAESDDVPYAEVDVTCER